MFIPLTITPLWSWLLRNSAVTIVKALLVSLFGDFTVLVLHAPFSGAFPEVYVPEAYSRSDLVGTPLATTKSIAKTTLMAVAQSPAPLHWMRYSSERL